MTFRISMMEYLSTVAVSGSNMVPTKPYSSTVVCTVLGDLPRCGNSNLKPPVRWAGQGSVKTSMVSSHLEVHWLNSCKPSWGSINEPFQSFVTCEFCYSKVSEQIQLMRSKLLHLTSFHHILTCTLLGQLSKMEFTEIDGHMLKTQTCLHQCIDAIQINIGKKTKCRMSQPWSSNLSNLQAILGQSQLQNWPCSQGVATSSQSPICASKGQQ